MPFAAALSQHPMATQATGEVAGSVLEALGPAPDLAVLFVSTAHAGALEDIAGAVRQVLAPDVLIGCTAGSVVGGDHEVEGGPAVSLWAARVPSVTPLRLLAQRQDDGMVIAGVPSPELIDEDRRVMLVLADPFSFPTDSFLTGLREQVGLDLPVVGGLASAAQGPGGNRLVLGSEVLAEGGVAVVIGGVEVSTVVSQGCRPIGDPMTVTRGDQHLIHELAGRPALDRVQELVASLAPDDLVLAQQGLHVGRVIDERKLDYGRGDFLIRSVLGADRDTGAVAVGDQIDVGDTVQFQVRDATSADEDLRALMAPGQAGGALLFTCNGRGSSLFGDADHDAAIVSQALAGAPVAGMSCAGEIGPVGGTSFLHGFTASVALFSDPA
ncbi:MAG TPA: FIST N-terminal domain-containing protein [Acidimicrobiales bacterium]|nr:FIST N-terminal domain-containing protein [Acidimicrobiales bacterium]